MGSRGPIGRKRKNSRSARTASGAKLAQLPADADRIFRRVVTDGELLEPADAPLVQLQAMWLAIGLEAFEQMRLEGQATPAASGEDMADAPARAGTLALTVTDTAHGNGEEPRKHPLLIVLRTATEQVRAIAAQLGQSPMARARLPEQEPEQMSLAEILFAEAMDRQQQ